MAGRKRNGCAALVTAAIVLVSCGIDRGGLTDGVVGTIDGFGSVIVNGVHYVTDGAQITVEGRPATEADLQVGYVVALTATPSPDGVGSTAASINFGYDIIGPLTAVDPAQDRATVLGQTVTVNELTAYGAGIEPASSAGLAQLAPGRILAISGFVGADGRILATRIELAAPDSELKVVGGVSDLDTVAATFVIGNLVVDYRSAGLAGFSDGQPANAMQVEARGATLGANDELVATQIRPRTVPVTVRAGEQLEVEGLIASVVSADQFDIAGFRVVTNAQTRYENGNATMLAPNVEVEVEGVIDTDGNLVADEVEFESISQLRIEATVDSIDSASGQLTVLGISVLTDSLTAFEDKSPAELRPFALADIVVGDPLRVVGFESADMHGSLVATKITRQERIEETRLRGVAETIAEPNFSILGVVIVTDGDTDLEDDFFATAEGQLVEAEGDVTTGSFVADKVEIKD